jgi:flagellar export protein FliJ
VDDLRAEAYKIQIDLIEATKKRRAVEIVKEHRLKEWKKESLAREQQFNDEISQQSFIRKKA